MTDPSTADLAAFYGLSRKSVLEIMKAEGIKPTNTAGPRKRMRWPREKARAVLAQRARRRSRHADAGLH